MSKRNIGVIVGTRPQIIKSHPLIDRLGKDGFNADVINTGQHYDYQLSKIFFKELKFKKPSINFNIGSGSPLNQISKILIKLENYFKNKDYDLIIVPGDTTSALAASLATSKAGINLAHLEAGARSNQFYMQEEINRRLIDHCSNFLFAPTKNCLQNLKKESVFGKSFFVGDTMYDLFLEFNRKYNFKSIKSKSDEILVTIHRTENIEKKSYLKKICLLINGFYQKGYNITFPVHPHTIKMLKKFGLSLKVRPYKPMSYLELMKSLAKSTLVITDSGGLQKEAYWMSKPCVTLRQSTEWIETVNEKANFLFPLSKSLKIQRIERVLKQKIIPKGNLFGNGNASEKIVNIIKSL